MSIGFYELEVKRLTQELAEAKRQYLEADGQRGECQIERDQLISQLAECYRLTGADPDCNEDWRLAPHAVEEVKRLREEQETAGRREAELQRENRLMNATIAKDAIEIFQLEGRVKALEDASRKLLACLNTEFGTGITAAMAELMQTLAAKDDDEPDMNYTAEDRILEAEEELAAKEPKA